MPYLIRTRENQHCVYKQGADGEPAGDMLGCHANESDAQTQLRALYAAMADHGEHKALMTSAGVLVALFLPAEVAAALALSADVLPAPAQVLPAGELHLTLAYLGDTAGVADHDPVALAGLLRAFASEFPPITGALNGVGRFDGASDDGLLPFYASFDSPALAAMRQALVDRLNSAGWTVSSEHGFVPHVTLAYVPAPGLVPNVPLPSGPITLPGLTLAWGAERTMLPLGAPAAPIAPKPGNPLKAVSITDDELVLENYMILWGGRDLEGVSNLDPLHRGGTWDKNADGSLGEFFTKATQLDSDYTATGQLLIDWEHGRDPDQRDLNPASRMPGAFDVFGYVDMKSAQIDEFGLRTRRVLNRHNQYVQWLAELAELGILSNSTEAVPGKVEKAATGELLRWPLYRDTITVTPMEPRMVLTDNQLRALKALNLPTPGESGKAIGAADASGAQAAPEVGTAQAQATSTNRSPNMNLIDEIKKLVPGLTDDQYNQIASVINLAMADPDQVLGQGSLSPDDTQNMMSLDDGAYPEGKALTRLVLAAARIVPGVDKKLPPNRKAVGAVGAAGNRRPPFAFNPARPAEQEHTPAGFEAKAFQAAYVMRFGDEKDEMKAILTDAFGPDYRQRVWDHNALFAQYLRHGEAVLGTDERKALRTIMFPFEYLIENIKAGYSVAEMKATMIEAQGQLGGYAVPPNMLGNISARLPGLTAIRGGGATVIDLVSGNGIDIPQYAGGDNRYVGNLRGQWGSETQAPGAQNAKLGMVTVNADVYTYKVPMSQSLVEDAQNLVSLVERDITDTLAIDEDGAFLTGDGAGKPRGILPGGINPDGLTEVKSGAASALTPDGVKSLKRGIATQYRGRGRWLGNSNTFKSIEQLKDGVGRYLFDDLSDTDKLLNRPVNESEAMPDVAAAAYPLIYGDVSGYDIVQKIGMTVQRFQDSNTGPNVVEFHVRRRIGGRVERSWLFAVQTVAA